MSKAVVRWSLVLVVASVVATAAQAPVPPGIPGLPVDVLTVGRGAPFELLTVEPLDAQGAVTGAPYSADAVTETTQTLADGNRIEHRTSVAIARDSRGRVRREQRGLALGPQVAQSAAVLITITDPAAGVSITLDQARQVAMRMPMRQFMFRRGPGGPREAGAVIAGADMRPFTMPMPPPDGSVRTFTMPVPPPPDGVGPATDAVYSWSASTDGKVGVAGWTAAAPVMALGATPYEEARATEALPPQLIEGVRAEGTRTTVTIPAGAIGNVAPLLVVSERWYSPELQVVLMTRRSDPRFGESVYRLTNLSRAEPRAEAFEVPPGYTVEEARPPRLH